MCLSYPRNKRSRVPETGPEPMCAAPRSAIYKKVRARNKGTKTDLQSGATSGKCPQKKYAPTGSRIQFPYPILTTIPPF